MANGRRLLVVSTALNVILGAVYILARPTVPKPEPVSDPGLLHANPAVASQTLITNTVTNVLAGTTLDWRAIESDDYKRFIANRRLAGGPEKTVRDVIVADVNVRYRH